MTLNQNVIQGYTIPLKGTCSFPRSVAQTFCILGLYPRSVSTVCILRLYPRSVSSVCILGLYPRSLSLVCILGLYPRSVSTVCILTLYHCSVSLFSILSLTSVCIPALYPRSVPRNTYVNIISQSKIHMASRSVNILIFRVTCCQVNARGMNVLYFYILMLVPGYLFKQTVITSD